MYVQHLHTHLPLLEIVFQGALKDSEDFCTTPNLKEVLLLTAKWLYWYSHVTSRVQRSALTEFSQRSSNFTFQKKRQFQPQFFGNLRRYFRRTKTNLVIHEKPMNSYFEKVLKWNWNKKLRKSLFTI